MLNNEVRLIFQHIHGGIYAVKRDSAMKYIDINYVTEQEVVSDLNRYNVTVTDYKGNVIVESPLKR